MNKKEEKARREAQALYDALERYGLASAAPPREKVAGIFGAELLIRYGSKPFSDHKPPPYIPKGEKPVKNAEGKTAPAKTATPSRRATKNRSGDAMAALSAMIGLEPVKEKVRMKAAQVENINARRKNGLPVPVTSHHMVFTGNPGTGKTTVARIVAQIFHELGLLEKGHLIETDRAGLVAPYVGQTEGKVRDIIASARGGVLFIDEAYALVKGGGATCDYGQDAINILLKAMEDERDRLVIIFAGYKEEMEGFLDSNPGLRSRCQTFIDFPDYAPGELAEIFEKLCQQNAFVLSPEAKLVTWALFNQLYRDKGKGFGNGRAARSAFELAWAKQSVRLAGGQHGKQALQWLEAADIPVALELAGA